ncbi:uncharacterized protein [Dermacentor albipictus]|uniref:uncharacterized protein isoform X2 n=1 Tax=Dermacentor albipictus TaxID=60249 RepID=UPI0038FCF985
MDLSDYKTGTPTRGGQDENAVPTSSRNRFRVLGRLRPRLPAMLPFDKEQPHKRKRKKLAAFYDVHEQPILMLAFLLSLQHYMTVQSLTVLQPKVLSEFLCTDADNPAIGLLVGSASFISGIGTLVQTTAGVRLPVIQSGALATSSPALAELKFDHIPCPANSTLDDGVWVTRLLEVQAGTAVAAFTEVFMGGLGVVGVFQRWITPLTMTPAIALIGLSNISAATQPASTSWTIAAINGGREEAERLHNVLFHPSDLRHRSHRMACLPLFDDARPLPARSRRSHRPDDKPHKQYDVVPCSAPIPVGHPCGWLGVHGGHGVREPDHHDGDGVRLLRVRGGRRPASAAATCHQSRYLHRGPGMPVGGLLRYRRSLRLAGLEPRPDCPDQVCQPTRGPDGSRDHDRVRADHQGERVHAQHPYAHRRRAAARAPLGPGGRRTGAPALRGLDLVAQRVHRGRLPRLGHRPTDARRTRVRVRHYPGPRDRQGDLRVLLIWICNRRLRGMLTGSHYPRH